MYRRENNLILLSPEIEQETQFRRNRLFSSLDYNHIYPENTPTKFTIPLQLPIVFNSNSLLHIRYYSMYTDFYNIEENKFYIDLFDKQNKRVHRSTLDAGSYKNIHLLVLAINSALQESKLDRIPTCKFSKEQ